MIFLLSLLLSFQTFFATAQAQSRLPTLPELIESISPYNSRRPKISPAKYIILHTTEGLLPGCLEKLKKKGEAHFLVTEAGQVIQIMDLDRLAKHSGRSVWEQVRGIDHHSIGIETEGFHNKPPTALQKIALKNLITGLRQEYDIPPENVLTHSMVAYGVPNRWQRNDHRGRKRCGMMMARTQIRKELGLQFSPEKDRDVLEKRLVIGDKPLFAFLFNQLTPNSIFVSNSREVDFYLQPILRSGNLPMPVENMAVAPTVTKPRPQLPREPVSESEDQVTFREIGKDGSTAFALAGNQYAQSTTIYFLNDRRIFTGAEMKSKMPQVLNRLPTGTKVLVGFVYGGKVTKNRSAYSIVKRNWSDPSTVYRLPNGKFLTGDEIAEIKFIPQGTLVLFQR